VYFASFHPTCVLQCLSATSFWDCTKHMQATKHCTLRAVVQRQAYEHRLYVHFLWQCCDVLRVTIALSKACMLPCRSGVFKAGQTSTLVTFAQPHHMSIALCAAVHWDDISFSLLLTNLPPLILGTFRMDTVPAAVLIACSDTCQLDLRVETRRYSIL
jgi:hypothetical protein